MKERAGSRSMAVALLLFCGTLFAMLPVNAVADANGNAGNPRVYAEPFGGVVAGNLNPDQNSVYEELGAILGYVSPHFDVNANAMVLNDGLFSQQEPIPGGYRIQLNNGDIALKLKPFELKGGVMTERDEVRSPYALFFNPNGFPTTGLNLDFAQGIFFYKTEWLQLNYNSANNYPNRGMNYKVYGLNFGHLRVGFQDVVIYLNQVFSPDFFFNPIPMYLTQLVNVQGTGNPWVQASNDNTLMGFFGDYTATKWYGYAQVLLDDISLGFLVPQLHVRHPWKIAWSFGGTYTFPFGTLGFYQAGASKYTFEPTYESSTGANTYPYQYTFYPGVYHQVGNQQLPIPYKQNYIGYMYGENNLAFMVTYKNKLSNYSFGGDIEYTISGSKSPDNPWGNLTGYPSVGWELLDQSPLEQRILLAGYVQRPLGGFTLSFGATLGYVAHELQLVSVSSGGADLWAPSSTNRFLYQFDLGVSYKVSLGTSK